jgi:hypothetical protein
MTEATSYRTSFNDTDWSLLVGLPQSVVWAASAVEPDSAHRSMLESEAGLRAIAEGRESGSPLVEAVAAEVLNRVAGDPDLGEEPAVVVTPPDPQVFVDDCLTHARQVVALLAGRVDEGDAGAYRHWLVAIATEVVEAAPSGGVLGFGGQQVTVAEQDFVHRLNIALGD